MRIEPAAEVLAATRAWLAPVRTALHAEFLAAYLTGSVLTQGFDPRRSRVNVLVLARHLGDRVLEALAPALSAPRTPPRVDPLFLSRRQLEKSLDAFPIEYLEIQERHLLLEGEDVFAAIEVPRTYLRLQCEQELRGKHIRLRQGLLESWDHPQRLADALQGAAAGFATLFRTLLRLRGEAPPADDAQVVQQVADLFKLDAEALLGPHLARAAGAVPRGEALPRTRRFVAEIDRLIAAIDELTVP